MPSQLPVPSVVDLLSAYAAGVHERDIDNDTRRGSVYDVWAGVGALAFHRIALRDRDIFRAIYFDFAEGDALASIASARYQTTAIADAAGTGLSYWSRSSASAGAGKILAGTRISVVGPGVSGQTQYKVSQDVNVGASDTFALVDIESVSVGPGSAIDTTTAPFLSLRIEDPLWDNTWQIQRLTCSDGTNREKDPDLRARIKANRFNGRVGYAKAITDKLIAAGANQVALFSSQFSSTNPGTGIETIGSLDADGFGDVGLNYTFVGDASFVTTDALLLACRKAITSVAVAGSSVQIAPMTNTQLTVTATVRMWQQPSQFDRGDVETQATNAIANYFLTRQNPFYFRVAAIRGAIQRAIKGVQSIEITTSVAEPALATLLNTIPLPRYTVAPGAISVTVTGPSS